MARMLDDSARAKLLGALLDQGSQDDMGMLPDDQAQVSSYPGGDDATRGAEQRNIIDKMGAPTQGGGDPTMRRPPMQQAPGQRGEQMIPVPASLAHAGMQALMMQASNGRSMGADGTDMRDVRGGFPRKPGDLEGAEVEADEDVGHNRGPEFPTEEFDEDRTLNQMRRRVSPERKPAKR